MKRILQLFALLFSVTVFSQITVSIQNLQYTNYGEPTVNVASCGTIDLASSNDTNINFGVRLTKPYDMAIGNGNVFVYTQKNSISEKKQKQVISVPSGSWSTGGPGNPSVKELATTVSVNVNEFDTSGGTFFVEYSDGIARRSCTYAVVRNVIPEFKVSPTSVSIPCNSTAPITFTESNVHNSPGSVTYSWTIGTGWNLSAGTYQTTTNTFTLTPTSYPPSNISVVAKLGGVNYSGGSSIMSLAPFTSTAAISGIDSYCTYQTASNFSINAGAGNTVAWSISNTSVGTLSSPTNSQVTVTSKAQGIFTLTAVITNSCGQTVTKTKTVTVGSPMPLIDNYYCPTESAPCSLSNPANNNYLIYSLNAPLGSYIPVNADWEWEKISGNFYFLNNGLYNSATAVGQQANIYINGANPTNEPAKFKVRVRNACGWGNWRTYHWNDGTTTTPTTPTTPPTKYFKVSPNPVTTYFDISLLDPNIPPPTSSARLISIYSQYGQLLQNNTSFFGVGYNGFSMTSYTAGIYYVNITFDSHSESHTIYKN
ncbi:T9SS type A sorting domain-containing protein [Flavobacterium sp. 22076]|uniref:T9SS type A sorting domain-containing protein n=1 Tax=unclassified Flavobacterium TaxID=196869 RepID=UPI003F838800